ncbi:hypothetical protein MU516_07100 [Paracoccus sp. YLB-12]|uniref:Uncharacterized protein n=1 Tax=Paracoccus maritimus TaxID=2933292 RepID=A0ABT2K7Y9_9RHOB|nr:hypothetical protein [Paracoccus sp. YLB-12]MCT4332633.1 hypothetical protein [Paracoccus sp. YLB-12]
MTTNASPTQGATPPFDLTPRSGQTDAEIAAWMKWKFPDGITPMSARIYWGAVMNTKPRDEDSPEGHEWVSSLTEFQRKIAKTASRQKEADPKVQAKRKAKRKADRIKRAADPNYQPEYQQVLAAKKAAYAAEIEAKEGREVRPYVHGRTLTVAERKAERKRATDKVNAGIRDDLASGRNPFSIAPYEDFHAAQKSSWEKMMGTATRQYLCDRLIANGEFNIADADLVRGVRAFCAKVEWCSDQPDDHSARDLIGRAVNSLRAAGAISKKGDVVSLHPKVEDAQVQLGVKDNPIWNSFS